MSVKEKDNGLKIKLQSIFSSYKWYEILFYFIGVFAIILVSIFCKSSILTIFLSILGLTYVFLVSKKFKFAIIFGVVYTTLYVVQSAFYKNWGEFIINLCVVLPILIVSMISWFLKNDKRSLKVQSKKISFKEILILLLVSAVVSVGFYFVLQYFNTPNLIVATLSLFITILGNYLLMRQSPLMFYAYILNNIVVILIWLLPVLQGEKNAIETLPMLIVFSFYLIFNILGAINWHKKENVKNENNFQENIADGNLENQ